MKHTLLFSLAFISVCFAHARVISPAEALNRISGASALTTIPVSQITTDKLTFTVNAKQQPAVYVFNNSQGFIVLSADDSTPALLGYSDNGSFDAENINPEFQYWLDQYAKQIGYARAHGLRAAASGGEDYAPIAPLTTTTWNQDAPYNDDCPTIDGGKSVTGCVATACAQVMKWHNYPPKGTGTAEYTYEGDTLSFDYGATTFYWDDMLNSYSSSATAAQKAAVASLMYACGVGVKMQYSPSDSGSMANDVPAMLVNHFGYDRGVRYIPREYYGIDEWNKIVYDNIKTYGPTQYSGQSATGGHSFVVDGYQGGGYFHLNWGWGGMSDGYFLLTALDPESQGIGGSSSGYNYEQSIIACVKNGNNGTPTGNVYEEMYNQDGMTVSSQQVQLGSETGFGGGYINYTYTSISGTMGLKLVDASGNISYIEGSAFTDMPSFNGYSQYYVTIPSDLAEGTYTVTPAFKTSAGEWRDIPCKLSTMRNLQMQVADGYAYFSAGTEATLSITDIKVATPIYVGCDFQVNATITNSSDSEYYGAIALALVNSDMQMVAVGASSPLDMQPGESQTLEYISAFSSSNSEITAGQYYICFVDAEQYTQMSDMVSVNVNAQPASTTLSATQPVVENSDQVDPKHLKVSSTVSCTDGYFGGSLTLVVFPYDESGASVSSVASYTLPSIFLNKGDKQSLSTDNTFNNGESGKQYFCAIYNGQQPVTDSYGFFTLGTPTGISDIANTEKTVASRYNTLGIPVDETYHGITIVRYSDGTTARTLQ